MKSYFFFHSHDQGFYHQRLITAIYINLSCDFFDWAIINALQDNTLVYLVIKLADWLMKYVISMLIIDSLQNK